MNPSLDMLLIVLRALAALLLLAFLGAVFVMLWRDFRAVSREVESRTVQRGRLIVVSATQGVNAPGTVFPLLPLTSIGRAPASTVRLNDAFASNEHASLTLRGGQWWLEDRGSSNGTNLNGRRVEEPVIVSAGDVIGIGQIELRIELE